MKRALPIIVLLSVAFLGLSSCEGSYIDPGALEMMGGSPGGAGGNWTPPNGGGGGGGSGGGGGGGGSGSSVSGRYTSDLSGFGSATITFSGRTSGTITITGTIFGSKIQASGTYTVEGNTIICTITKTSDPDFIEIGSTDIYTIIDANTIRDDKGDTWTKR